MIKAVMAFDKIRNTVIQESFCIELLLFRIERSHIRWFGHESRMSQERLSKKILNAKMNRKRRVGRVEQ